MDAQTMNSPPGQTEVSGVALKTVARVSLPLTNEIVAVLLGQTLTHPDTTPEARAEIKKRTAEVVDKFDSFKVAYVQNTADTLNICVPEFPDLDCEMEKITEAELEQIAGGEFFVICTTSVTFAMAKIAVICGIGALWGGAGTVTTLGTIVAGWCIAGAVVAAQVIGAVGVAAGVGVGIAAAVGAFDGSQSVNVAHGS
ncbi:MAG: hypothetical protein OXU83_02015 [Gammaproteobacteria bacterium]|nr:hypothetical protein [Gammaproteobacteria bacterium]